MALFEDLVSVAGISTLGVGSFLTFKAINIHYSKTEHHMHLDQSQKIQIFNNQQAGIQHSFQQAWNMLVVAIVFSYPWLGGAINSALYVSALIVVPIAVIGTIRYYDIVGAATYFNVLNILVLLALAFWVINGSDLLVHTSKRSANLLADFWSIVVYTFSPFGYGENILTRVTTVLSGLIDPLSRLLAVLGVAIFFSVIWRTCFSFIKGRDFDASFHSAKGWFVIGAFSWFAANNGFLAIMNQRWDYLKYFGTTLIP